MLTRSASKKKPGSPEKSVKKKEEIVAASDNVRDYKVMIPSLIIPSSEGNVRSPRVLVNFNVLPGENGSDEVIHEGSNTVFNCGVVVINVLPSDLDKKKLYHNANTNGKLTFSTPKLKHQTIPNCGRSVSDEESGDENYRTFSPRLTSSLIKCRSQLEQKKLGVTEGDPESDSPGGSFSEKISLQCNMSYDVCQELSLYKGVRINGGYKASDFKKKPVVQIVPVSEEEIRSWSKHLSHTTNQSCSQEELGSPDSEVKKMVRKEKLLKILKKIDNSISRQLAKKKEKKLDVSRKNLEPAPHVGGQSCDKNSSQNGGITPETRRALDFNRCFGDFQKKVEELANTQEHFIPLELLEKCVSSQDSICTEVFDDERLATLSPVSDILDAEGRCSNVNSPTTDPRSSDWNSSAINEDIITALEKLSPDIWGMSTVRDAGTVSAKSSSEGAQRIVANPDDVDPEQSWKRSSSARERKKKDSLGKIRNSKFRETVTPDATLERSKMYRDRQTLLSIQLACINQEIMSRNAQIESSSKKSKPFRKSEKQSEDDVTDFGSARRTRRSLKIQEEAESKATPKARNTPKTQSKGPMDEYVTVTPRTTRAKSLRREVTEVMERKRRKLEDLMETPKTDKTPKKESPAEDEVNDTNEELSSNNSRRSRKAGKENETGGEAVEEEPSTPRKRGSARKSSQAEAVEKDGDDDVAEEVMSSSKSRKSKSPMKSPVKESEDEFDEKTVVAVSSPLKKKKEAAERLRAKEEKLGHTQKEVEVAVTSSPRKIKSPATAAREENAETPILSTPKKTTRKSLVDQLVLVEDSAIAEVPSSPKQKEAKSPKKHVWNECSAEEIEEGTRASPKETKIKSPKKQHVQEESEVNDLAGGETPTRRTSKSPIKTCNVEVPKVVDKVTEEVVLAVATSPKRQKSVSPQKKQHAEVESIVEISQVAPPEREKSISPKKRHVEEREPEEIVGGTSTGVKEQQFNPLNLSQELKVVSPKLQESFSAESSAQGDESGGSVLEEYMCDVSPGKQKMMKKSTRLQDVDVFCPDDSGSDGTDVLPAEQQKTDPSRQEHEREESESVIPPVRKEKKSPKKLAKQDDEEGESEKRNQGKSPRKKLKKRKMTDSESDEVEESVTSMRQQSQAEELGKNDSDMEKDITTSPERQEKRETEERVSQIAASPDKQKRKKVDSVEEEDEEADETSSKSKKSESRKRKDEVQEDVEVSIPQMGEDLLASISSRKTSVKVKDRSNTDKKHKRKNERKQQKLLKRLMKDDGFIPLEVGGATNFSVVGLDKFNTSTRHPAFDLKRHLLYGSRVKRIPYSQIQSYHMKLESRKMRF